jgi:hypothetical protein
VAVAQGGVCGLDPKCARYPNGIIDHFDLWDAETDTRLVEDWKPTTPICLKTSVNIRAIVKCSENVESVTFKVTGPQSFTNTENIDPYFLFNDVDGDIKGSTWTRPGVYKVKATPWTQNSGLGSAGTARTIEFEVVDAEVCCTEDWLAMDDQKLFDFALQKDFGVDPYPRCGRPGGYCAIIDATESGGACDLYVKAARAAGGDDHGYPGPGTGCACAPDFPKSAGCCLIADDGPGYDPAKYCTPSGVTNAVAQLRLALLNNDCDLYC